MNLLLIRADAYRESPYMSGVHFTSEGLEVDEYDLRAKHFGIFGEGRQPVAYLRVIHGDGRITEPRMKEIAEGCPGIRARINHSPERPLPLLSYFDDRCCLGSFTD